MVGSQEPDAEVIARYLEGDAAALARIREFASRVVYERGYYIPFADRQDVLQEVLLSVFRAASVPGFRLRHGVGAFVRAMAHRRCIDWLRRHRRDASQVRVSTEPIDAGPEGDAIERERIQLARTVLARLSDACRDLITLRAVEGRSYAAIAEMRGRSEQGLRNQLYKCLRKARALFLDLESSRSDGRA